MSQKKRPKNPLTDTLSFDVLETETEVLIIIGKEASLTSNGYDQIYLGGDEGKAFMEVFMDQYKEVTQC